MFNQNKHIANAIQARGCEFYKKDIVKKEIAAIEKAKLAQITNNLK